MPDVRNKFSWENPGGFLEETAFELYFLDLREWGVQQMTNKDDEKLKIPWTNLNIINYQ